MTSPTGPVSRNHGAERVAPIIGVDRKTSEHKVEKKEHRHAPAPLDPAVKKTWTDKLKERGSAMFKGLSKDYKSGFKLMGHILDLAIDVEKPKSVSAKEIGKFAAQVLACPFRVGLALLMDANVLLGMVLATPIMAVARAFPDETKFLFRSRTAGGSIRSNEETKKIT